MELPRPLSNSSMSLYGECPLKYKFKYIDGIPEKPRHFFSFGQSVHSALEFYYSGARAASPTLPELLENYKSVWVSAGYKDEFQEKEYFENGVGILTSFHAKHSKTYHTPFQVEYLFNFEFDGVPITGRIDRIDKMPDGRLAVLDYKTGKKLATGRLDIDTQLTLYQFACETELKTEVAELTFYHLPSLKEHRCGPRGNDLILQLKDRIVSTADSIKAEKFDPKPSEAVCRWCDYRPLCPVFKNQFSTATASATARAEPAIAALVDDYGAAADELDQAKQRWETARKNLAAALEKRGYVRAFGERFEASLTPGSRWEFSDKKKVLDILRRAGLYEKVLAPSAQLIYKILDENSLDADARAQLTEIGERLSSPDLKARRL